MQIRYSNEGTEPLAIADVKNWLKVDFDDENTLITDLIKQARELAEEASGLSLLVKTIEYFEDDEDILSDWIKLPYPAHDSITEVVLDGATITEYSETGLTQKIIKVTGFSTTDADSKGLKVTYTTIGTCPAGVKLAMLKLIGENYERRTNSFEGGLSKGLDNFYNYLSQFKVY